MAFNSSGSETGRAQPTSIDKVAKAAILQPKPFHRTMIIASKHFALVSANGSFAAIVSRSDVDVLEVMVADAPEC